MRIPFKVKITLAPVAVLLLFTALLGFLQYTYWDLSAKRQEAARLKLMLVALVEADMIGKQIYALTSTTHPEQSKEFDSRLLTELNELYGRLGVALNTLSTEKFLNLETTSELDSLLQKLNPKLGLDTERYRTTVIELRSRLTALADNLQSTRDHLQEAHNQDIATIVARTTFITMMVLIVAIVAGVLVSLTFSRNIVRRIQHLTACASRIANGEMIETPAPVRAQDELDDLALSINRMTDRLIRVVSTEKLLEGAEEERRRIARDIHDQTLADLSAIQRDLEQLHCGRCEQAARHIELDLQRCMSNLREVMDDLHPQVLDILGLGAALQSYLERQMSREGLPQYHLYVSPSIDELHLSRQVQLALYRITLEAIQNIVRHARATRYEVVLECRGPELHLAVEDNGVGFTPSVVSSGRGLNNIRERARAIGAQVSWTSSRFHGGTRFEVTYATAPEPAP